MLKTSALFLTLLFGGCATRLTDAGRSVEVLYDGEARAVAGCLLLGPVRGETESFLANGEYGVIYATKDARNRAARLPGADTLLVTDSRGRRFGGEVTGLAYDCSAGRGRPVATAGPLPPLRGEASERGQKAAAPSADESFAKAKKCQLKGGVWIDGRCIVPIE